MLLDKDKSDAIRGTPAGQAPARTTVADHVFAWLQLHLLHPEPLSTLTQDRTATAAGPGRRRRRTWSPSVSVSTPASRSSTPGEMIDEKKLELLTLEYQAFLASGPLAKRIARGGAVLAVVFALFMLCGDVHAIPAAGAAGQPGPLDRHAPAGRRHRGPGPLGRASDPWRAELVPLMLFGMTMAIVYRQELALLLSGVLAWIIVLALGLRPALASCSCSARRPPPR